jgi:hypothetical protein
MSDALKLKPGARVSHHKFGKGEVFEFYEFYNQIYVDVMLDDYDKCGYFRLEDLKFIEDEKSIA